MLDILLFLIVFTIGYLGGRFVGYKQGFQDGFFTAPLIFRQQSLEQQRCVLCNTDVDNFSLKQEKS
ncbi:hypothetical protein [Halanaerobaculum tunisiense]